MEGIKADDARAEFFRQQPGRLQTPGLHLQQHARGGVGDSDVAIGAHLGHEESTILLTNDSKSTKNVITRYAKRMLIENALSDAVRFFHMNALSSSVGIKVDFDMALLVIASGLYRQLAKKMRGYAGAQADHIFRDLINMPATVTVEGLLSDVFTESSLCIHP